MSPDIWRPVLPKQSPIAEGKPRATLRVGTLTSLPSIDIVEYPSHLRQGATGAPG
jgi:hypothetical protein